MSKVSKEEAGYKQGVTAHHCGKIVSDDKNYCEFFEMKYRDQPYKQGSCTKVEGVIDPYMGCKLFKKVGT